MQIFTTHLFRTLLAVVSAGLLLSQSVHADSRTATAGQTVTFSVSLEGTAPFSYQWRKNGVSIPAATNATYTINSVTTADTATYTLAVSNAFGGPVISDNAVLTVNPVVAAPSITSQPASLIVTAGQSASFSVTASGSTLTYQWRKNGTAIPGATASNYSIASTTSTDAASYSVVVSNTAGSVTSAAATLTVNPLVIVPTITSQPATLAVTEGFSASFSVTASGSTLTYQWRKNGTAIPGATLSTYTIAAVSLTDAGSYSVTVTNSAGLIASNSATLTVSPRVNPPWISSQPASLTVTAGQPASFSVTASGSAPFTYQWYKNGTAISGATSATYSIAATTSDSAGSYYVIVSNPAGSSTSAAATLTVNPAITLNELTPQSFSSRGQNSPNEGIAQLFDGQVSTKWLDFSATTWVQVILATPASLQAYSLTSANDVPDRDPASWTLSGSNDGVTWTVIENRTAQSWTSRHLTRDFVLATPSAAYSRFRFDFRATAGSITQLAELELFGSSVAAVQLKPLTYSARGQYYTSVGIAKLFDGRTSTKWVDLSATSWVKIGLVSPATLRHYTLTSAGDTPSRDPASWTLSGSNDGVTWTVIETRTGQRWSSRKLRRDFILASPSASFSQFRFDFKVASGAITQLAELQLFGN